MIEKIEECVGKVAEGWSAGPIEGVQVARSLSVDGNFSTYFTIGLSNFDLVSVNSGRKLRQELLLRVRKGREGNWIPAILEQVAGDLIKAGQAVLRGDCTGSRGPFFKNSPMEALYFSMPIFLAENCMQITHGLGPDIALVWAIPITRQEALFCESDGWQAFEEYLEGIFEDLFEFRRV